MTRKHWKRLVAGALISLALTACSQPEPEPEPTLTPEPTATSTATLELTATSTPTLEPTATSTPTPEPTIEPTLRTVATTECRDGYAFEPEFSLCFREMSLDGEVVGLVNYGEADETVVISRSTFWDNTPEQDAVVINEWFGVLLDFADLGTVTYINLVIETDPDFCSPEGEFIDMPSGTTVGFGCRDLGNRLVYAVTLKETNPSD